MARKNQQKCGLLMQIWHGASHRRGSAPQPRSREGRVARCILCAEGTSSLHTTLRAIGGCGHGARLQSARVGVAGRCIKGASDAGEVRPPGIVARCWPVTGLRQTPTVRVGEAVTRRMPLSGPRQTRSALVGEAAEGVRESGVFLSLRYSERPGPSGSGVEGQSPSSAKHRAKSCKSARPIADCSSSCCSLC
jgi:hypothetical protein